MSLTKGGSKMKNIIVMFVLVFVFSGCSTLKGAFASKSINQQVDKIVDDANKIICKGTLQEKTYAAAKLSALTKTTVNVVTMCP